MSSYQRPAPGQKTKPCKSEAFYRQWSAAHWYCAACGRTEGLSTHHIVKQGRAHEAANLLRLCLHPCHDLAELLDVPHPDWGKWDYATRLLPKLTIGICLSLKLRTDPGELSTAADFARLEQLRGSRLPDLEQIPDLFVQLFRANRPEFGG